MKLCCFTRNVDSGVTRKVHSEVARKVHSGVMRKADSGFARNVDSGLTRDVDSGFTRKVDRGVTREVHSGVARKVYSRFTLRGDRRGDVSLGYILILVICALVMTAMALIAAGFISTSGEVAKQTQMEQVRVIVETEVEEAIYMGTSYPGAVYSKNITLPKEIYGVQYYIELSFKFIYINGSLGDMRETLPINPTPGLSLGGKVSSSAGIALIKYDGKGKITIS